MLLPTETIFNLYVFNQNHKHPKISNITHEYFKQIVTIWIFFDRLGIIAWVRYVVFKSSCSAKVFISCYPTNYTGKTIVYMLEKIIVCRIVWINSILKISLTPKFNEQLLESLLPKVPFNLVVYSTPPILVAVLCNYVILGLDTSLFGSFINLQFCICFANNNFLSNVYINS